MSVKQTAETKESYVWLAKLAQEAKRYDDMVQYMRWVAVSGAPMTYDEDNMLATAYKTVLDSKRSARRTLGSVEKEEMEEEEEEDQSPAAAQGRRMERVQPPQERQTVEVEEDEEWRWKSAAVRRYCDRVDAEVRDLCAEMLALVDGRQSSDQVAADVATSVFYWKLCADYNRYAAEAAAGDEPAYRAAAVAKSRAAYERADGLARQALQPTDPMRLGLMLNRSVFLYQVCGERRRGHDLAMGAYNDAVAEIDTIDVSAHDDVTQVMRLIRDNLSIWAEEGESEGGGSRADDDASVPSDETVRPPPSTPPSA